MSHRQSGSRDVSKRSQSQSVSGAQPTGQYTKGFRQAVQDEKGGYDAGYKAGQKAVAQRAIQGSSFGKNVIGYVGMDKHGRLEKPVLFNPIHALDSTQQPVIVDREPRSSRPSSSHRASSTSYREEASTIRPRVRATSPIFEESTSRPGGSSRRQTSVAEASRHQSHRSSHASQSHHSEHPSHRSEREASRKPHAEAYKTYKNTQAGGALRP